MPNAPISRVNPMVAGITIYFYPEQWGDTPSVEGTALTLRFVGIVSPATKFRPARFRVDMWTSSAALPGSVYKTENRRRLLDVITSKLEASTGMPITGLHPTGYLSQMMVDDRSQQPTAGRTGAR